MHKVVEPNFVRFQCCFVYHIHCLATESNNTKILVVYEMVQYGLCFQGTLRYTCKYWQPYFLG